MNVDIEKKAIPILLFFILIAFFIPLSLAPLFDLDEGAFSEATREMLVGKDYITTYLNGELRFDKPILIYWFQLLSVKTFGLNEFALRFPSAIAGACWAGGIYLFSKKLFNTKIAFFATLFMISSLQINMIAKASIADSLLNLCIALSMFGIYLFFHNRENRYIYWTFLFIALGTLTKGPIAIMIPLIVSLILFITKKEFKLWLKMVFNPIGILIFLVVALPWYIAEYIAQGELFIDGFFFKHNLSRFSSPMEAHSGSIFYFIPVLIVGMMPFTYFVIKAISRVKSYIKDGHLIIDVIDGGIGIEDDRDLFAPFVRTQNSNGVGLGLFLVKSAADSMCAKVELIKRDDGNGTIARLTLPKYPFCNI